MMRWTKSQHSVEYGRPPQPPPLPTPALAGKRHGHAALLRYEQGTPSLDRTVQDYITNGGQHNSARRTTEDDGPTERDDDATAEWCDGEWGDELWDVDVHRVMAQVRRLLGFKTLTHRQKRILHELVEETIKTGSITWGATQAQQWGVDKHGRPWTFDDTRLVADAAYIALHKTLSGAARARWMELAHSRMTAARVLTHLDALNPHRNTVLPMAEEGGGIPIWVPDDFVPNGKTAEGVPSLSPQTHSVGGALRRMVSDGFHQKHLCFIMTTAEALLHNPHISPSQWATKAGHPKERNCNNCSWGSRYHQALNSDAL